MEQKVFDVEAFNRLLVALKLQGNAHQLKNEAARMAHNEAYFQSKRQIQKADEPFYVEVPEPVNDAPDTAPVSNSEAVGKNIVEFISTIPGVITAGMLERVSRPESIALSDRAISASLRRENGGEVGMGLTFAQPDWSKHKLMFDRVDPAHNRIEVDIEIGPDSVPIGGEIGIGTIEDRQFVSTKQKLKFGQNGEISEASSEYKNLMGEKLNIIKMIEQVTTPEGLGKPIEANKMVQQSRQPMLEMSS